MTTLKDLESILDSYDTESYKDEETANYLLGAIKSQVFGWLYSCMEDMQAEAKSLRGLPYDEFGANQALYSIKETLEKFAGPEPEEEAEEE